MMSARVIPTINDYTYEYIAEWKIENLNSGTSCVKTPIFSPTPHTDIKFYLQIQYTSTVKFSLVKISGTKNIPSLKMQVQLVVNNLDGSNCKAYSTPSPIHVCELAMYHFSEEIKFLKPPTQLNLQSPHHTDRNDSSVKPTLNLVVNCQMKFFEYSFTRPIACRKWRTQELEGKPSILGDIEFYINNREVFSAHKVIFEAHSLSIAEKLDQDLRSRINTDETFLKGLTGPVIECFFNYLYTGEIKNKSWDTVKNLYALAHKYQVGALKRDCAKIIESFLTIEKVCDILPMAYDSSDDNLKQEAHKFVVSHIKELIKTHKWKDLVLQHPMIGYDVMESLSSK